MLELLNAGRKDEFDKYLLKAAKPADRATLNFRMRPFGFASQGRDGTCARGLASMAADNQFHEEAACAELQ